MIDGVCDMVDDVTWHDVYAAGGWYKNVSTGVFSTFGTTPGSCEGIYVKATSPGLSPEEVTFGPMAPNGVSTSALLAMDPARVVQGPLVNTIGTSIPELGCFDTSDTDPYLLVDLGAETDLTSLKITSCELIAHMPALCVCVCARARVCSTLLRMLLHALTD